MSAPAISISPDPWHDRCKAFPISLPEACIWLAAQQVVPSLLSDWLALGWKDPPSIESAQVAFRAVLTALFMGSFFVRKGRPGELGLTAQKPHLEVLWGLGACIFMGVVYLAGLGIAYLGCVWLGLTQKFLDLVRSSVYGEHPLDYVLGICLAYPVLEEIWFRALMYPPMRKMFGRSMAMVLLSVIFAAAHQATVPITQFIGGLAFAYAYERRQNLIAPIMLHIAGNGSLVVVGWAIRTGWLAV